jgi:eukaryotic-like serine/threonine-protein kinase
MPETVLAGRYRLDEPLGGSMAEVYLATDLELERRVVVKLLGRDAEHARFEREARAAAALASPNVVQLFDYGEADGRPYMVLEHLSGGTLEERLASGQPLPDAETDRIARDIATGLAHAHARGLVHRDLKPANILFDAEERAKIADFGIARLGDSGTLTEAGTVLGTAAYISPEQAGGEPATPASDVYSFGVMLFRMLTGRLPFTSSSAIELVKLHRNEPAPAVTDLRPDAPAGLESVAAASLAKDPADRPQDGAALLAELGGAGTEAATTVLPVATAAAAVPVTGPRLRRRIPLIAAPLALLVLLLGGVALALAVTHDNSTPSAPPITFSTPSSTRATTHAVIPVATSAPTTTEGTTTRRTTTAKPRPATTAPPPVTTESLPTAPTTTLDITTTAPITTAATTTQPPPPPPTP